MQDSKNKIVILDGYNLLYRAKFSARWQKAGPHTITYNFFRSLRKLVEDLDAEKVYFVLEGKPKARLAAAPDYKGTREYEVDENYSNQKREIIQLLVDYFPITVVRHPDYECDDVIAHIAYENHPEDDVIIVSTDTDFYQVFSNHDSISVYNPVKKAFVEPPEFDYVVWKSLRGDGADNIQGFKGVGDKTALKLTNDKELLEEFLSKDPTRHDTFNHNMYMIKFHEIENKELLQLSTSNFMVEDVLSQFTNFGFGSIIKEKPWQKFVETFGVLENE